MVKRSGLRSESCYKSDDEESCYESDDVAIWHWGVCFLDCAGFGNVPTSKV